MMGVPVSQMWTVSRYVLTQRLLGRKRYPLVLMLEPLFRCNLACAGCGKIQHPVDILRKELTPEQCFAAVEECGAPIVSIPGGEPLLHSRIDEIVAGLIKRKKYIYLCTNGLLLEKHLCKFEPSPYLSFSVHIDGVGDIHDQAVCRKGVYETAIQGIKAALNAGFRVTTNSTFFRNADPAHVQEMFDELTALGVEGMMVSPGYEYEKAPDQNNFLPREQTVSLFQQVFSKAGKAWRFNQSPLFLEFLKGRWDLECTPWGNPTYNLFGWQKPCYLVDEGHVSSFQELMDLTDWSNYGRASGNPKCTNCMVHSGYEATAVQQTFTTWQGFWKTAKLTLLGTKSTSAPLPMLVASTKISCQPASFPSSQSDLVPLQVPENITEST
ncbi:adenosyl-hopene transferase HpnH [Rubinisphaera sp.]|uniref:adenosyl-hopene transferase HpnH n=2 Tax=Rubinisphaera TaxID=1649490 RepID=UPI0025F0F3E4|nr:adenosyl-hopene transferase HpnH [Rubinisphaera sp.]